MNYGWKYVRGYHGDNNIAGEDSFIQNYIPHSLIANDSLFPALFSWCDVPQPTTGAYLDWCILLRPMASTIAAVGFHNGPTVCWW